VYHNAAENIIPVTMELGGKSPNIFFPSVAAQDDKFFSKAVEGALMCLNQGNLYDSSRILVHEDIADHRKNARTLKTNKKKSIDRNNDWFSSFKSTMRKNT
jgi:acyl-CoA reductase-like NAD-dependent aldehyde dehydrogenase